MLLEREPLVRRMAHEILDIPFNLVDYQMVLETVDRWVLGHRRHYIALANPESVVLCDHDAPMRQALTGAGLTLPDGVGVILAARLLRLTHYGRVTGPTLMLELCRWGQDRGYRHFLCGGGPGIAERLAARLSEQFPRLQVVGTYCPPFRPLRPREESAMLDIINATEPDIVWVGLGAPKQEKWMARYRDQLNAPVLVGVGAAFDFHSGNAKWAPAIVRRLGLEWAYRLIQEPRRMWRRNVHNAIFLTRVLRQCLLGAGERNPVFSQEESPQDI